MVTGVYEIMNNMEREWKAKRVWSPDDQKELLITIWKGTFQIHVVWRSNEMVHAAHPHWNNPGDLAVQGEDLCSILGDPGSIYLQLQEKEVLFSGDIHIYQLQNVGVFHPAGKGKEDKS